MYDPKTKNRVYKYRYLGKNIYGNIGRVRITLSQERAIFAGHLILSLKSGFIAYNGDIILHYQKENIGRNFFIGKAKRRDTTVDEEHSYLD